MNLINANGYNNNGSYNNKSNSSLTNNNGIDNIRSKDQTVIRKMKLELIQKQI